MSIQVRPNLYLDPSQPWWRLWKAKTYEYLLRHFHPIAERKFNVGRRIRMMEMKHNVQREIGTTFRCRWRCPTHFVAVKKLLRSPQKMQFSPPRPGVMSSLPPSKAPPWNSDLIKNCTSSSPSSPILRLCTEKWKMVGTWLGEIRSYSSLAVLPDSARVLLNKIYQPFFISLYVSL